MLDAVFGALANPTRRAILDRLRDGEATVNELLEPFDISQPALSRHLRVLEEAGMITRGRDAQRRPCRLSPRALHHASAWMEAFGPAPGARFPRLDPLLDRLQQLDTKLGSTPTARAAP